MFNGKIIEFLVTKLQTIISSKPFDLSICFKSVPMPSKLLFVLAPIDQHGCNLEFPLSYRHQY